MGRGRGRARASNGEGEGQGNTPGPQPRPKIDPEEDARAPQGRGIAKAPPPLAKYLFAPSPRARQRGIMAPAGGPPQIFLAVPLQHSDCDSAHSRYEIETTLDQSVNV